ncbi:MAG: DUF2752 domain-containing protein [Pyrinomonadaceae bacterium]
MQAEQEIQEFQISPLIERVTAASGVAAIASGSAFVAYFDPTSVHFFPVCPLFSLTGFACPGCGLTRGFHALFHGDVWTALDFNALIPVWAVIFAYVSVSLLLLAVRGKGLPMWPTRPRFLWTFMIVLLAFGFLRNIPIYPFTILFP